jgi:hypothetical protein
MIKRVKDYKVYEARVLERIGWVGAVLVVGGYYLNANQHLSSWLVWIIGNLCIAGYSAHKKAWPTVAMSLVIAALNIYGYFCWK